MLVYRPDFEKRGGLVTVVTQDYLTREVLMVAYTDEAGYLETLEKGVAVYYSTSRKKRWAKGEESGNVQVVKDILIDCDGDAIVYLVEQQGDGVACHSGARSCFYRTSGQRLLMSAPKAGSGEHLVTIETTVGDNLL